MESKKFRQYVGILAAVVFYYLIHEGAHLVSALAMGVFKSVRFMGVGMQIDVNSELMTSAQMGIFCAVGAIATLVAAYVLVALTGRICKNQGKLLKSTMYYITIAMLLLDPCYLSILCGFFGGGDMNGIALLIPEAVARVIAGVLLVLNAIVFWKVVLPQYQKTFAEASDMQ